MPTARELLDQIDALMRRNRSRDKDKRGGPATLTDALGARRENMLAPTVVLADGERGHATPIGPGSTIVARPNEPHGFRNTGETPMRSYGVHASPARITNRESGGG